MGRFRFEGIEGKVHQRPIRVQRRGEVDLFEKTEEGVEEPARLRCQVEEPIQEQFTIGNFLRLHRLLLYQIQNAVVGVLDREQALLAQLSVDDPVQPRELF